MRISTITADMLHEAAPDHFIWDRDHVVAFTKLFLGCPGIGSGQYWSFGTVDPDDSIYGTLSDRYHGLGNYFSSELVAALYSDPAIMGYVLYFTDAVVSDSQSLLASGDNLQGLFELCLSETPLGTIANLFLMALAAVSIDEDLKLGPTTATA